MRTRISKSQRRPNVGRRRLARKNYRGAMLALFLAAGVGACGTSLEDALSGIRLLPDPEIISAEVHNSCDGFLTEDEILSGILAARIDQSNGVTKQQDLASALQGCAIDALLGGPDIDECNACKRSILDQVFGN